MEEHNKNRLDIQGLRAIAVGLVLLYHFWPERLTGGYIGVDVFFVISGFLITLHLLQKPPDTVKKLFDFWARRIRRLMPAATVVLVVTLVACLIWLPDLRLVPTSKEAIASAVYLQNWQLAATETDYLSAEDEMSPLTHYWSLSVEEQFYIFWPILIAFLVLISRKTKLAQYQLAGIIIGAAFLSSLIYSIYLTSDNPEAAYFVTPTRIWELALGGLVAVLFRANLLPRKDIQRSFLAWAGFALIGFAALSFSDTMAFPGYVALLPTIGAALVILAMSDTIRHSPTRLLKIRPIQYIGDISYSVYLWHWPIIILLPFILNLDVFSFEWKLFGLALTFLLAAISKKFIEDPARHSHILKRSNGRTYAYGLASISVVVLISIGTIAHVNTVASATEKSVARTLNGDPCVGAAVKLRTDCFDEGRLVMTPAYAKEDRSILYEDNCWTGRPYDNIRSCTYGDPTSTIRLALVGNSHAGPYAPILIKLAENNGWRVDTYLASKCFPLELPLEFNNTRNQKGCTAWAQHVKGAIANGSYQGIILSSRSVSLNVVGKSSQESLPLIEAGYTRLISDIIENGPNVLVIRDVPIHSENVPYCISETSDVNKCATPKNQALEVDPQYEAARTLDNPKVDVLDLTNILCDENTCLAAMGGLIMYFDNGHLTNSFAQTLEPIVAPAITTLVE